jgi:hypothetical protein
LLVVSNQIFLVNLRIIISAWLQLLVGSWYTLHIAKRLTTVRAGPGHLNPLLNAVFVVVVLPVARKNDYQITLVVLLQADRALVFTRYLRWVVA